MGTRGGLSHVSFIRGRSFDALDTASAARCGRPPPHAGLVGACSQGMEDPYIRQLLLEFESAPKGTAPPGPTGHPMEDLPK